MDAAEIVEHGVERNHVHVIFKLLRKRIGEPGEATHVHTHGEVLALDMAGRYMPVVRVAFNAALACSRAFRRAVLALMALLARGFAVYLDKLGIVHIAAKGALDGF